MNDHNDRTPGVSIPESRRLGRAVWGGALLIIVVGAILFGWNEITARRRLATARQALDSGQNDHAEFLLGKIVEAHPASAEGHYLMARLFLARNKPDEALQHLASARKLGYPEPLLERIVGLIYSRAGSDDKAEPLLRHAWDAHTGTDPEVADVLCRIYFQSFRFPDALAVIARWSKENPDDLRPLLWRAEVHSRNDPGPEAQIKDFDLILARDPNQVRSRLARANAYRQLGRMDKAKEDYDLYVKAKPDDPAGHVGAAKAAEGLDDEDSALAHYEQVLRLEPDNVVGLQGMAAVRLNRKDPAGAIALLDKAILREPNDPESYYRKGRALEMLGKRDEAKKEFATQARLQKEQTQIENIRKGLVRDPNNVKLLADAAAWLLGHGYDEEGVVWAEKTLAKDARNVATIKLLVEYYTKKGNAGRANFYRLQLPAGS